MSVLNKPEVVSKIAEELGESQATVSRVLKSFEETVTTAVSEGTSVKISGFLSFERIVRSARKMKNPSTGQEIDVPEKNAVRVRPLSRLRRAVSEE